MGNGYTHLVKAALVDFRRNKVRTFLTSLGITIGVLSVVMLIALGLGLKNYLKQQFESLGSNLIMVMPGSGFGGEGGFGGSFGGIAGGVKFDEKDVRDIARIGGVEYSIPAFFKTVMVETGEKEEFGYVIGSNEELFVLMNMEPQAGEFFTKTDINSRSKNVVLGKTLAEELFDSPEDALGKTVRVADQRFKVMGVAEASSDPELDKSVMIPYKTTFGSLNPNKNFVMIYIGVENEDNVSFVKERAEEVLSKRYDEDDFSVTEQEDLLETINQIFNIVNGVLVAIGSISLVVGGIGIMNIMYATVTERIKEVGIRRAVGATQNDILKQFLTESVLLSIFGGLLGLALASLIVLGVRPFFPVAINFLAVVITLVVSSAIGIFFGVFPARRASKLPPIEAIRYE
jgi:putative ABC transport system permease protein